MIELIADNVRYAYDRMSAWYVNQNFEGGLLYQLIGANGSGKSTIGRLLTGILSPKAGSFLYDGIPINTMSNLKKRSTFLFIPQEPQWSFVGDTYSKHLKYFKLCTSMTPNSLANYDMHKIRSKIDLLSPQSIFSLHNDDIYLLSLYEVCIWPRPVIFIDECPNFDNNEIDTFLFHLLRNRMENGLITLISRHIEMNTLQLPTNTLYMEGFIKL